MFRDYLKAWLSYRKDDNVMSARTLDALKKEIREDLLEAFELGEPIIREYPELYDSSSSFVDFLFRLLDVPPIMQQQRQPSGNFQNVVRNFQEQLDQIETEICGLKEKSEELLFRVGRKYDTNDKNISDQSTELGAHLNGMSDTVASFKSYLDTIKNELGSGTDCTTANHAKNSQLITDYNDCRKKLVETESENENLKQNIENLKTKNSKLIKILDQPALRRLSQYVDNDYTAELLQKIDQLEELIRSKNEEISQLREQQRIQDIENQKTLELALNQSHNNQLKAEFSEQMDTDTEVERLGNKIKSLEDDLKLREREISDLQIFNENITQQLQNCQTELDQLNGIIAKNNLNLEYPCINHETEHLKNYIKELENLIQKEKISFQEKIDEAEKRYTDLEGEKEILEDKLSKLESNTFQPKSNFSEKKVKIECDHEMICDDDDDDDEQIKIVYEKIVQLVSKGEDDPSLKEKLEKEFQPLKNEYVNLRERVKSLNEQRIQLENQMKKKVKIECDHEMVCNDDDDDKQIKIVYEKIAQLVSNDPSLKEELEKEFQQYVSLRERVKLLNEQRMHLANQMEKKVKIECDHEMVYNDDDDEQIEIVSEKIVQLVSKSADDPSLKEQLKRVFQPLKKEYVSLRERVKKHCEESISLKEQCNNLVKDKETTEQSFKDKNIALDDQIQKCNSDVIFLNESLAAAVDENNALKTQLCELQNKCMLRDNELMKSGCVKKEIVDNIKSEDNDQSPSKRMKKVLEGNLEKCRQKLKICEEEKTEITLQYEQEIESLKQKLNNCNTEYNSHRDNMIRLQEEIQKCELQNEVLKQYNKNLQIQIQSSNQIVLNNHFQMENETLRNDLEKIMSEKNQLSSKIDQLLWNHEKTESVIVYLDEFINRIKAHILSKEYEFGSQETDRVVREELLSKKNYVLDNLIQYPIWLDKWLEIDNRERKHTLELNTLFRKMYPKKYNNVGKIEEILEYLKSTFKIENLENIPRFIENLNNKISDYEAKIQSSEKFRKEVKDILDVFDPKLNEYSKINRREKITGKDNRSRCLVKKEKESRDRSRSPLDREIDEDWLRQVRDNIAEIYDKYDEMMDIVKYIVIDNVEMLKKQKEKFKEHLLTTDASDLQFYDNTLLQLVEKELNSAELLSRLKSILRKFDPIKHEPGTENLSFMLNNEGSYMKELQWVDSVDRTLLEMNENYSNILKFQNIVEEDDDRNVVWKKLLDLKLELIKENEFSKFLTRIIDTYSTFYALSKKLEDEITVLNTTGSIGDRSIKYNVETNELNLSVPIMNRFYKLTESLEELKSKSHLFTEKLKAEIAILNEQLGCNDIDYDKPNLSGPILKIFDSLKSELTIANQQNKDIKNKLKSKSKEIEECNHKLAKHELFMKDLSKSLDIRLPGGQATVQWQKRIIHQISSMKGGNKYNDKIVEELRDLIKFLQTNEVFMIQIHVGGQDVVESIFKDIHLENLKEKIVDAFSIMLEKIQNIETRYQSIITETDHKYLTFRKFAKQFVIKLFDYQHNLPMLDENTTCMVCKGMIEKFGMYRKLECHNSHIFCEDCFQEVFGISDNPFMCPLCRQLVFPNMKYIMQIKESVVSYKRTQQEMEFEELINEKDEEIQNLKIQAEKLRDRLASVEISSEDQTVFEGMGECSSTPSTSGSDIEKIFHVASVLSRMYSSLYKLYFDECQENYNEDILQNILQLEDGISRCRRNVSCLLYDFFVKHAKIITRETIPVLGESTISQYIEEIEKNLRDILNNYIQQSHKKTRPNN